MHCQRCGTWTSIRRRHCGSCGIALSRRALLRQLFTAEIGDDYAATPRPAKLASPRSRVLAAGIDVGLAMMALSFVGALGPDPAFGAGGAPLRVVIVAWATALTYPVLLEGTTGQTVGKRMVGIQIVMESTGSPPGYRVAAHRFGARAVFWLFGFLALTDPLLRTVYDRSAGTIVVKVPTAQAASASASVSGSATATGPGAN